VRTRGSAALDTHLRPAPAPAFEDGYRITTLHPRTYNEARQIGEHFRNGTPVIMNLTEMDDVDAKRLVDFAAGLIFGLRGSIERVTAKVFLLSPEHVEVTAEDKARIAESGFFNQS
jgi:cell division inhibitor SepF